MYIRSSPCGPNRDPNRMLSNELLLLLYLSPFIVGGDIGLYKLSIKLRLMSKLFSLLLGLLVALLVFIDTKASCCF